MTEFYFNLTEEKINDMEAVEYEAFERAMDGEFKLYRLRPAIARFMVDEKNNSIPYVSALKMSEKMKMREVKDFIRKFFEAMSLKAVPKATGMPSEPPSIVPTVASHSQPG